MSNIVLTSTKRILGLPVKFSELHSGEQVVATNAPLGMLYITSNGNDDILHDYTNIKDGETPDGEPISLPLIEDYKNSKKKKLLDEILEIDNLQ